MRKGEFSRRIWGVATMSGLARTADHDIHQTFSLPSLCRSSLRKRELQRMNMTQSFLAKEFFVLMEDGRCIVKGKLNKMCKQMWLQQPEW